MLSERYRQRIVERLEGAVSVPSLLRVLLRYPLGLSEADGSPGPGIEGKLLRPSLVLFSCEALGGTGDRALPLAVALELVHNFSLVHDDIQDGDEVRRGRASAWKALGTPQAINAGDGLLVCGLREALGAGLPDDQRIRAQESLLSATFRMIEGQAWDLAAEGQPLDLLGYEELVRRKTGALFGCALELGALAAGRPDLAAAHRALGEELGLAFQIKDDILGIWGDPERTGKPKGSDLRRRKRSFPLVFALQNDPDLGRLWDRRAPENLEEILARLEAIGARGAAEEELRRHLKTTSTQARELPWSNWAREDFQELLAFLAEREW